MAGYGKWRFPSGLDEDQRVESKPRLAERVVTCTLTHIGNIALDALPPSANTYSGSSLEPEGSAESIF